MRTILELRTVSGRGGGPEKTILNGPRFLHESYRTWIAYIRPAGDPNFDLPARAERLGVDLIDLPERGPIDPRTLIGLYRLVKTKQPDLIHAHDYKSNVLGIFLGRWFRIPVITTMHGYVSRGGRLELYYKLDRWALRRMNHVIAVSQDLLQIAIDLGIPPSRRTLVENGIDLAQYRASRDKAIIKEQLGVDARRQVVGAVGRLASEKGFDILIRSVDRLIEDGWNVALLIAGEGDQHSALQSLISELGRGDRIRLLGHLPDPRVVYQAMDVFASSSLREGLPNVVLEAMAMGVPVVATRVAGVPRLIEDGRNGLLIDVGDTEQLRSALARLLTDANLRDHLGGAGRMTVEGRYNFERRMERIREIYDRQLAAPCTGAAP